MFAYSRMEQVIAFNVKLRKYFCLSYLVKVSALRMWSCFALIVLHIEKTLVLGLE